MAITKNRSNVNIANLHEYVKVQFVCPICKSKKMLKVPKTVINQAKQLTTISIAKGLVCEHQFQAFVDKNFNVRGYQKVDFEFEIKNQTSEFEDFIDSEDDLFENLIIEGNYLEYKPRKSKIQNINNSNKKEMTLKDIYEEFWEFIDNDNEEFGEFIQNDVRRRKFDSFY